MKVHFKAWRFDDILSRHFHFQLPRAMYGHCLVPLNETTMFLGGGWNNRLNSAEDDLLCLGLISIAIC